jgi:hypothetical protein
MREHPSNKSEVLAGLPDRSSNLLIRVLKAFLAFQKQVSGLRSKTLLRS